MRRIIVLMIAAAVIVAALLAAGCSEKDVPIVVDNEVIRQYMENSSDARELFDRTNLMLQTEYTVSADPGAVFKIVIDSTKRRYDMNIHVDTTYLDTAFFPPPGVSPYQYHRERHIFPAPLGELWDGEVIVDDFYYVRELRIVGTDTTETPRTRAVTRYAFFLKLGHDGQPYRGWKLWAFNGGGPSTGLVTINADNDTTFYGDLRGYQPIQYMVVNENLTTGAVDTSYRSTQGAYMRLDRLPVIDKGIPLYISCPEVESRSYYRLTTALTDSGFEQMPMDRVSSTQYVDTVQIAAQNSRIWNLLFMQNVTRIQEPLSDPPRYVYYWDGWCVPYRVNQ